MKNKRRLKKDLGDRWRGKEELGDLVFTTSMGSPCKQDIIVEKEIKKSDKTNERERSCTCGSGTQRAEDHP